MFEPSLSRLQGGTARSRARRRREIQPGIVIGNGTFRTLELRSIVARVSLDRAVVLTFAAPVLVDDLPGVALAREDERHRRRQLDVLLLADRLHRQRND